MLTADANERDARLATIDLASGGEKLAVLRSDGELSVEALSVPAFDLIQMPTDDRPLGEALECVPVHAAAQLLADFLGRGFFAGFSLPMDDAITT